MEDFPGVSPPLKKKIQIPQSRCNQVLPLSIASVIPNYPVFFFDVMQLWRTSRGEVAKNLLFHDGKYDVYCLPACDSMQCSEIRIKVLCRHFYAINFLCS